MPVTNSYGRAEVLLTTDEAAQFLRLSRPTLERYRLQGTPHLPFIKIGGKRGRVLYRMSDLLAFLERCTRGSTSDNLTGGGA